MDDDKFLKLMLVMLAITALTIGLDLFYWRPQ
jgi:nitrogen fixation-related uncharacterized protein